MGVWGGVSQYFIAKSIPDFVMQLVFPLIFSGIVYPMTELRPGLDHFAIFYAALMMVCQVCQALALLVGCAVSTPELATALAPAPLLPFIATGGFLANRARFRSGWIVVEKLSFISYTFEILVCNEFEGLTLARAAPPFDDGDAVLDMLRMEPRHVPRNFFVLAAMALGYRALACLILVVRNRGASGESRRRAATGAGAP